MLICLLRWTNLASARIVHSSKNRGIPRHYRDIIDSLIIGSEIWLASWWKRRETFDAPLYIARAKNRWCISLAPNLVKRKPRCAANCSSCSQQWRSNECLITDHSSLCGYYYNSSLCVHFIDYGINRIWVRYYVLLRKYNIYDFMLAHGSFITFAFAYGRVSVETQLRAANGDLNMVYSQGTCLQTRVLISVLYFL